MNILKTPLICLLAGIPSAVEANGFRLVSQDAFAASRGEAFAATADNPSAVHYNPAGLSQLDGRHFHMGTYALYFDPTFQPPAGAANAGRTYDIETKVAVAPQMYYSHEVRNTPLTLGMGVYAPHGASVTWPQDTGFRAVATEGELTYLRVNPVAAIEIRPGLSFAVGAMIDYGDIGLEQGLRASETPSNKFRFEGDDLSAGYNFGLLWRINDRFTFGATYRSPVSLNFDGQTNFELLRNIQPTEIPASVEFEFPYTAVFGLSYRPTPDWNIELNADYSNWSSIDSVTIQQKERPRPPVQQNIPVNLGFKSSWIMKLGATRQFDDGWYASAGYLFNENSVPGTYYSPTTADLDRHFLTVGLGRRWSRFTADVAYQIGYGPDRNVEGSTYSSAPAGFAGQNADGTYDFISHALLFSVGMKF